MFYSASVVRCSRTPPNYTMASAVETRLQPQEPGFSTIEGANWSEYLAFRPLYPPSFFGRIYAYHFQKSQATNESAHDVGSGCGIVASTLAYKFHKVTISDPNDGYATLARKLLVEDSGIDADKLSFLQEGAEQSSVSSGTVDLITAAEMMHWTDTEVAVKEFGRQLRPGGTLALTYYTVPRIVGNDVAQKIWRDIWRKYADRAKGNLYDHAFSIVNSGFKCIEFPEAEWHNVKRVYINSAGSTKPFEIDGRIAASKLKDSEEVIWEEGDKDWQDLQCLDWLKGYLATWVPKIPEAEIQDLWDGLDTALGGQKAMLETPLVLIFATKRA